MWRTTFYALCGQGAYVVQGLENPVFIGPFASPTPHNISALEDAEETHQPFLSSWFLAEVDHRSFALSQSLGLHFQIAFRIDVGRLQ